PHLALANKKNGNTHHLASIEEASEIWGKSRGPVLVRVQEVQKMGQIVELKGQIKSQLTDVQVEWKLPDGAVLVEGELQKSVPKNMDNSYDDQSIKVDISSAKNEPIVFLVYIEKEGERVGHSRVYKWNSTAEELEHVEKIKMNLKARKARFIR
ncbi:MAG: hypothetical protein IT287_06505, partial [Bdellovibrionaceae bacterium]|nr:hypothetical protein [Pseudobdellovibrionaceae bacterium]